ncbi:MAG: hypothetical protein ABID40_04890 [Candidatus Bipolaricaulota bacterium]
MIHGANAPVKYQSNRASKVDERLDRIETAIAKVSPDLVQSAPTVAEQVTAALLQRI